MVTLTFGDLQQGLDDLLNKRKTVLLSLPIGAAYAPMLTARRDALAALPEAIVGRPLREQLADTDVVHDGFGGAIYFQTESYLRAPDSSPALLEAAGRIRAGLIPALKILKDSYATEAARAAERKLKIHDYKADLEQFPIAGGKTLWDWANGYIDAGVKLGELLSDRADVDDKARAAAGVLRAETIGLIGRFRAAIADAVAFDPNLPRDLDTQLFAYFDQLTATRDAALAAAAAEAKRAEAKKAEAAKAEAEKAKAEKPAPAGG